MGNVKLKDVRPERIYITKNKDDDTYELLYEGIVFESDGKDIIGNIRYPKVKLELSKHIPLDIRVKEMLNDDKNENVSFVFLE